MEADLSDPARPGMLFDTAEEQFGPVDILINNATGWLADTFPRPAVPGWLPVAVGARSADPIGCRNQLRRCVRLKRWQAGKGIVIEAGKPSPQAKPIGAAHARCSGPAGRR